MFFSFCRIPYVDSGLTRERNIPEEIGDVPHTEKTPHILVSAL